jgi:hypothetical protein
MWSERKEGSDDFIGKVPSMALSAAAKGILNRIPM